MRFRIHRLLTDRMFFQCWHPSGTRKTRGLATDSLGNRGGDRQLGHAGAQVPEHDLPAGELRQRAGNLHATGPGAGQGPAVRIGRHLQHREHLQCAQNR